MTEPESLQAFLRDCLVVRRHLPWPRFDLSGAKWRLLVERLASEDWELLALWGDRLAVHVLIRDPAAGELAVLTRETVGRNFESLGAVRPGMIRL